ncbi:MAG: butyrate kinase [Clostridiales bacterium]|jgi:butyrate kinase|nr:butyrate kinase [Clostridiales bacterium]
MYKILAINPGSTSTKLGLYQNEECIAQHVIRHSQQELEQFTSVMEQVEFRRKSVLTFLINQGIKLDQLSAIVVRGGLLRPVEGGVYRVDTAMMEDLSRCQYGCHASNLGAVMALPWAAKLGIPAFTVDPVTVDELVDTARLSGLKGIPRLSMSHALNMKAAARSAAVHLGKDYEAINLVIVHLGSGISVSAHRRGRMIDVNNANNEGPFSLERSGTLPALALIDLCFTGEYSRQDMIELVTAKGGLYSYLGTKDFKEVETRVEEGDDRAKLVVESMAYQVSKEVGAMAAVLDGEVDTVVLTGGMAYSQLLTALVRKKVSFIAPVMILAGEEELDALAKGAFRALRGEEEIKSYGVQASE